MLYTKKLLILLAVLLISGASLSSYAKSDPVKIIPAPLSVKSMKGEFIITAKTKVLVIPSNQEALIVATLFTDRLDSVSGYVTKPHTSNPTKGVSKNTILFSLTNDAELGDEGYRLTVEKDNVIISANTAKGMFYGVQSMLQLLPPQIMSPSKVEGVIWKMEGVKVLDKPRFGYRGMHLDVGRHFMPADFIKKYIDILAMFKLNTFHWHLTEDQGWRIEIKQYPKLTSMGSMRAETVVGHAGNSNKYDGIPHGGFYTQEQVKDIVDYASKRFITIIPEIEMPGHSVAALTGYPQFSCTGGPFKVATTFGVFDDIFCAGNDSTFIFLQNVLDEVMSLFPSKYIHIGGDEAPKARWHNCPKCQARMKAEGLKDEHELQSYFIKRIEKYVVSKGRRIIGWDEILEGGLAPEATVMSWRGMDGGIAAAREHHDVIMASNSHTYFDHYQADPNNEPLAIGGYLTLKDVYGFEPVPDQLTADEAKHILGAQGQIWTEYMKTPDYVEYMLLPRMLALSEVLWTPRNQRNYESFTSRLDNSLKRLGIMGVNYSQGSFRIEIDAKAHKDGEKIVVNLMAERANMLIRYTLDGNLATAGSEVIDGPLTIHKKTHLIAGVFSEGQLKDIMINRFVEPHKAAYKEALVLRKDRPNAKPFSLAGLVDGFSGTAESDKLVWNSLQGRENEITVDLKKSLLLKDIEFNFLTDKAKDLANPSSVEIQVSEDNKTFIPVSGVKNNLPSDYMGSGLVKYTASFNNVKAKYVRLNIKAESTNMRDPQLLIDEIIIR